jgi:hypothetical protein
MSRGRRVVFFSRKAKARRRDSRPRDDRVVHVRIARSRDFDSSGIQTALTCSLTAQAALGPLANGLKLQVPSCNIDITFQPHRRPRRLDKLKPQRRRDLLPEPGAGFVLWKIWQ